LASEDNGEMEDCPISYYEIGRYLGRNLYGYSYEARKYRGIEEDHLGVTVILKKIIGSNN
jgi:hypothetical protein